MTQTFSRRDFLKLAALGAGALATRPLQKVLGQVKEGEPVSFGGERVEGGVISLPKEKEPGKIIQTGLKTVEINGQNFNVEIDDTVFRDLILLEAGLHGDAALVEKATGWLEKNDLEVEIYHYAYNPILYVAGGYFVSPEFHGGRAKIGIPDNSLEKLYEVKNNPQTIAQDAASEEEEINSVIIIPHEIDHLLQYINSPYGYLAKTAARIAEVLVAWFAAVSERKGLENHGANASEKRFAGFLRFGSVMFLFQALNAIFGLSPHSGSIHTENEKLLKQINEDQRFKHLSLEVVKFSPV